MYLNL
jgi:hypothetical protein